MSIKKIVDTIEVDNTEKVYYLTEDIMKIVSKFVIKEKLILYGGYALNMILPENKKIYRNRTPADYDCYSYNAKKHAIMLANILKKKKYRFLKVRMAIHENTYKVFVGAINILDLTLIDKNIYNIFLKIHQKELSTKYFKYYKNKYIIVPICILIRNFYYELARPKESYYRWEKIDKRLKLFNTVFNKNKYIKSKKNLKSNKYFKHSQDITKCKKKLLNYFKKYKTPIIGMYALKFIKNIKNNNCCNFSKYTYIFQILSFDYEKDCKNILHIIKQNINLNKYRLKIIDKSDTSSAVDIVKYRYRIQLIDSNNNLVNLIEIIKVQNNCFSIQKINNYIIGSYDTIICFIYSQYIAFLIAKYINPKRVNTALENLELDFLYYENLLKNLSSSKRYKTKCYGKELSIHNIYKKNWYKKMSILKY